MIKNPLHNAGDVSLIPGQGTKIPHTVGQLSLHATTRERTHVPLERSPCTAMKSPFVTTKDLTQPKLN